MKKDIVIMIASGMPLQSIGQPGKRKLHTIAENCYAGEIVQNTSYQGFPVIRSEGDQTVIGFVRKTELRYALGESVVYFPT